MPALNDTGTIDLFIAGTCSPLAGARADSSGYWSLAWRWASMSCFSWAC
jgi:hypothetical protein